MAADDLVLSVRAIEAEGLLSSSSILRSSSVYVAVKIDDHKVGRSASVDSAPLVHWDYRVQLQCGHGAQNLIFEVVKPGLLGSFSDGYLGGCAIPIASCAAMGEQRLPLYGRSNDVVGTLRVDVRAGAGLDGALPARATPALRGSLVNQAALPETPSYMGSSLSQSSADYAGFGDTAPLPVRGLTNHATSGVGLGGTMDHPGLVSQSSNVSAYASMPDQRGPAVRAGSAGLANLADEDAATGSRPNALPRAGELLAGIVPFDPGEELHRRKLLQAIDELRHVPSGDLNSQRGQDALEDCTRSVEALYADALARGSERDANGAIWMAGRLPVRGDVEHTVTLQDKLRKKWATFQLESSLAKARAQLARARSGGDALDEFMEALDLAEFHARLADSAIESAVGSLLSELRPHLLAHLQRGLEQGSLDEVERSLNAIGASRLGALGLQTIQARLEGARGMALLRQALVPMPGQIGYPVLKQRQLRHAVLNLRSALAGEQAAGLRREVVSMLLVELLPACMQHSADSAVALLETAFSLSIEPPVVWKAAQDHYNRLSKDQKVDLAGKIQASSARSGVPPPGWLLTPRQASCQHAIRTALAGRDAAALQAALAEVRDVDGGREVCRREFSEGLQRLKAEHRLPDGWDIESMIAGSRDTRLLSKKELKDPQVLQAFDHLLKQTAHPVWTRDRTGSVTQVFQAVRVVQVMNAATWSTYVQRRDEITRECAAVNAKHQESYWARELNGIPLTRQPFERIAELLSLPPLVQQANEGWYIHGTSHSGAEAISSDDFDIGRARPTGLFGAGIYLAESVSKSDEYVEGRSIDGAELFPVLLCRASLGHIHYCDELRPDKRQLEARCLRQHWHCVLGDRKKTSGTFREFVVYDNLQVFPGFIVYYKRVR